MKRYRIKPDTGCYDGCIPITVYWVQVYAQMPIIGWKWVNIKGFDTRSRAEELLGKLKE